MKKLILSLTFSLCFFLLPDIQLEAKIKLPAIFTDNMVLQQQTEAPIWGESSPRKKVKIITSWNRKQYITKADESGNWKILVKTPQYGGPYSIVISDGSILRLVNVMIGEVWLCSGQSNMEMPLAGWGKINNYEQEIAAADYPNIRLLQVEKKTSTLPLKDVEVAMGGWVECSPKTIPSFSATAYFFGRELYKNKQIPIGLIHTSWGGTLAEAWTSGSSLKTMPDFVPAIKSIEAEALTPEQAKALYDKQLADWNNEVIAKDKGFVNGQPAWSKVSFDDNDWKSIKAPGYLEKQGFPNFDGIVWLRKSIEIPESWASKRLTLSLGTIDDNDVTYFNGEEIGRTNGWDQFRNYPIPAILVEKGKAVITVRVHDTGGEGGFYGEASAMKLTDSSGNSISLSGEWKCNASLNATEISPAPRSFSDPNRCSVLFNAMLNPLIPYGIRGAIWYQGEANADRAYQYRELLPLMIKDWRQHWGKEFPFYIVQLANFKNMDGDVSASQWAELREAQLQTALHLKNTGLAVTIDIGDTKDIHPKNKQEVGRRLSLIARANAYGENISYSGPEFDSYQIEGNAIRLRFKHTEGGLVSKEKSLKGFYIAGLDHKFLSAEAKIDGDDILVSHGDIINPVAVRYAWADDPTGNLYNGAGLPASPFRTDDWPGITWNRK